MTLPYHCFYGVLSPPPLLTLLCVSTPHYLHPSSAHHPLYSLILLLISSNFYVQVEVIRIKNRLDPAHNAARSAGYRDVALNLRVMCAAARRLGVDTHVCEVQLLLRIFADLKVAPGPRPSPPLTSTVVLLPAQLRGDSNTCVALTSQGAS